MKAAPFLLLSTVDSCYPSGMCAQLLQFKIKLYYSKLLKWKENDTVQQENAKEEIVLNKPYL